MINSATKPSSIPLISQEPTTAYVKTVKPKNKNKQRERKSVSRPVPILRPSSAVAAGPALIDRSSILIRGVLQGPQAAQINPDKWTCGSFRVEPLGSLDFGKVTFNVQNARGSSFVIRAPFTLRCVIPDS